MPRVALTSSQKSTVKCKQAWEHTVALVALNNLKQEQIAQASGKTQQQVSKELRGKSKLSLEVFMAVQILVGEKNEKKNIECIVSP